MLSSKIEYIRSELRELSDQYNNSHYVFKTRLERILLRTIDLCNIEGLIELKDTCITVKEKMCCSIYPDARISEAGSRKFVSDDINNIYKQIDKIIIA